MSRPWTRPACWPMIQEFLWSGLGIPFREGYLSVSSWLTGFPSSNSTVITQAMTIVSPQLREEHRKCMFIARYQSCTHVVTWYITCHRLFCVCRCRRRRVIRILYGVKMSNVTESSPRLDLVTPINSLISFVRFPLKSSGNDETTTPIQKCCLLRVNSMVWGLST